MLHVILRRHPRAAILFLILAALPLLLPAWTNISY